MTTRVVLGNRHAIQSHDNGGSYTALPKGKRATVADWDDIYTITEIIEGTTNPTKGVWAHAAVGPSDEITNDAGEQVKRTVIHPDATPAWVASSNDLLAQLLAQHYDCEVRPLEETEGHPFPADLQPKAKKSTGGGTHFVLPEIVGLLLLVPLLGYVLSHMLPSLKTNAGNDFQYNQMAGSASASAVGKWVGITTNATAPAATDTTLTSEIATAGGGLIRKVSTPAHTTGAASYTLTTVFTVNGSDTGLPVTIAKRGVFDQLAVGGNLIFETLVSPTAVLSAIGDNLTLTDTISM